MKNTRSDKISTITFVYMPPNICDIRDEKIELRYRTGLLLELNYRYKRARLY